MDAPLTQITILKGLAKHIQSSLIRLKKKMPLTNPLLPLIKNEFGELFQLIHKEAAALYPFKCLPEEETGFIVLHFEAAILQSENRRPYSALVITSGSNGVNIWLEARLRKKLPKLKKIKFITPLEIVTEKSAENYDIILSTTDLENSPFDYYRISIFISDSEMLTIHNHLEQVVNTKTNFYRDPHAEEARQLPVMLLNLKNMESCYATVNQFLTHLYIDKITDITRNTDDNLRSFSQSVVQKSTMKTTADTFFKHLSNIEAKQKVITGETSTAYFITKSNATQPSIHVFCLNHFIEFQTERQEKAAVSTVVIFNLPKSANTIQLEIVTYLVALLTEDDEAIFSMESGDKNKITALFIQHLETFLQQKNVFNQHIF